MMTPISQAYDPYVSPDPNRRIQWDGWSYYRDLWQWDFFPSPNYQCKTYDIGDNYHPEYDEPPARGNDMGIFEAWKTTKGSGVKIAIADTGCDPYAPEMTGSVYAGVAIYPSGQWARDDDGHGTRVASTIAARNNNIGIVGVAPEAELYIIKCERDCRYVKQIVEMAITSSASILVMPWGFSEDHPEAKQAMIKAGEFGMVVVCSAFNQPIDEGSQPDFPIQWRLPNVIGVTSCMMDDMPYSWAATSDSLLHLYAPGRLIITANPSTIPGPSHVYTSGTSFAAPKVAGALALIKSAFPNLTMTEVIDKLLAGVDRLPQYRGKTITGGRLHYGWPITGPKEYMVIRNGVPVLVVKGPSSGSVKLESTSDFKTWYYVDNLFLDTTGTAEYYPSGNMQFYRTTLMRPASEVMAPFKSSGTKMTLVESLYRKVFPKKRPEETNLP